MPKGGFSQVWESSQHLRAARLEADINWLLSVIGNPAATSQAQSDLAAARVSSRPHGFAARLQDTLGLRPPSKSK